MYEEWVSDCCGAEVDEDILICYSCKEHCNIIDLNDDDDEDDIDE